MKTDFHIYKVGILIGLFLTVIEAGGAERYEFFNGVRSLGMGGAQVAIVNDETALMGNPAGLGRLRDYFLTVADPEIALGEDTQGMVDADITAFMDPQEVLDLVETRSAGTRFHQTAQLFPSFVVTNFGIGLFAKYGTDGFIDETSGLFNLHYREDVAVVMGFNFRMFDGKLKMGFSARGVNRTEINRTDIVATSTGNTINNLAKEGFGIGGDAGIILTAPVKWLPALAAVYRDVGNTSYGVNKGMFHSADDSTAPDTTPGTLDVGFSVQPILGKKTRLTITGEVKDVLVAVEDEDTEDDISRRTHYGLELNMADAFFIRGGVNQGYWTAGIELSMFNYQLQGAMYGEEVGTKDNKVEDRRYVAKFSWRF